jgi:hypothetical protein
MSRSYINNGLPVLVACVVTLGTASCRSAKDAARVEARAPVVPQEGIESDLTRDRVSHDDLGWLVGRWKVIARLVRTDGAGLPASDVSRLEWINVYYPFFLGWDLTLELSAAANRAVTAEFVVRRGDGSLGLASAAAMDGLTRITARHLFMGSPPAAAVAFRYRYYFDSQADAERLSLETADCSLVLQRIVDDPLRRDAPFISLETPLWSVSDTRYRYEMLKRERLNR